MGQLPYRHRASTSWILMRWLCLLLSSHAASTGHCQEAPAILPERSIAGGGGQIITSQNYAPYRSLMVPELLPLVRAGRLEFEAIRALHFDWRYNDAWYSDVASRNGGVADGSVSQLPKGRPGILFLPPFMTAGQVSPAALREAGSRALWAMWSVMWSQGALQSQFDILAFPRDPTSREIPLMERLASGMLTRIAPGFLATPDATGQVFRELIEFSSPSTLATLKWLSFRFLGSEEDVVWVASPAIQKSRQVTGVTRMERLFPKGIAADDLLGWSGKPETMLATYDKQVTALIPFPSHLLGTFTMKSSGCLDLSTGAEFRLNFEASRFSPQAPWLPTQMVWVPRSLHRIVLLSNDPFSPVGRQVLYLDELSLLPVVRIVYDRVGRYLSTHVTAFGLGVERETGRRYWYPANTIIEDDVLNQFVVVQYQSMTICADLVPDLQRVEFDPRRLAGESVSAAPVPTGRVAIEAGSPVP